jgi:hypothetical protein
VLTRANQREVTIRTAVEQAKEPGN